MNYTNYERQIVERFGIALKGWPLRGRVCNPSKAGGRAEVEKLLTAVQSETCKWVKLTQEQLASRISSNKACQARGEQVYQPRRQRMTKTSAISKDNIPSDESGSEDD
jgi:hypothetical protein